MSRRELRGLAADLRTAIPRLARLSRRSIPFFEDSRALSSCFNKVIIPWSNDTVEPVDPAGVYPHEPAGRVFETTGYGLVGIASESRSGDANGQYIKTQAGGGHQTIIVPGSATEEGEDMFGVVPFPILGAMPMINDSRKTPFRPDEHCEDQEPPNLQAGVGAPPQQAPAGPGDRTGVTDNTIKIGVHAPVTGAAAIVTAAVLRGGPAQNPRPAPTRYVLERRACA
jgi:hypothetical protein